MRKEEFKWLWHKQSNVMAIAHLKADLPLITICDDDVAMINPFYSYPYKYLLDFYGWEVIGDLTHIGPTTTTEEGE